jgi:Uma2 family endonuclease
MTLQVTLPEIRLPVQVVYPSRLTPAEFYEFCEANPDVWCELTDEGKIVVTPPAGTESGLRSGEILFQLALWARQSGGRVTDASAGFALPDGSVRAPDAAWIDEQRLIALGPSRKDPYFRSLRTSSWR